MRLLVGFPDQSRYSTMLRYKLYRTFTLILILKGGDRCLRFQLFLSYPTGTDRTTLKVIIKDGSTVKSTHSFTDATGYKWREVSIDLPAVDDLKVSSSSPTKAGGLMFKHVYKNINFEFLVLSSNIVNIFFLSYRQTY